MTGRSSAYQAAREIEITACEWAEGPDSWDACPWADEIRYVPTDMEEAEALAFFDQSPVEAFEAWVCDLGDRDFWEVARALATLRQTVVRYNAERADHDPVVAVRDILESF